MIRFLLACLFGDSIIGCEPNGSPFAMHELLTPILGKDAL
jgi:hypothetical protein